MVHQQTSPSLPHACVHTAVPPPPPTLSQASLSSSARAGGLSPVRREHDSMQSPLASPGPADYDQTFGTLGRRVIDAGATPTMPGSIARPMRKSASFASSSTRSTSLFGGHSLRGPRKGPHEERRARNYLYELVPGQDFFVPSVDGGCSPVGQRALRAAAMDEWAMATAGPYSAAAANSPPASEGRRGIVDMPRVRTVFARFEREGALLGKEVWGALHHYGMDLTSKQAHRLVRSYTEERPNARLDCDDFVKLLQRVEAVQAEAARRHEAAAAARGAAEAEAQADAEHGERVWHEWASTQRERLVGPAATY